MIITFDKTVLVNLQGDPQIPLLSMAVDGNRLVEIVEFPEAAEPSFFDRQNRSKQWDFQTKREHADENTAEFFTATHDELLPVVAVMRVEGTFGGFALFYRATLQRVRSHAEGCASFHTYQITTGNSSRRPITL